MKHVHPCDDARYRVTKLLVKHLYHVQGKLEEAVGVIDEHLKEIMDAGDIERKKKVNVVKLLKRKARLYFQDQKLEKARENLLIALKFASDLMFDPVIIYAELSSCYFALGDFETANFINDHITNLDSGPKVLFRSPYLKTVKCHVEYGSDDCVFSIAVRAKRENMENYLGFCHFSHTDEDVEIQPVPLKLQPKEGKNVIVFERGGIPRPEPGQFCEVHIDIYSGKDMKKKLGTHFQLFFINPPPATRNMVLEQIGL